MLGYMPPSITENHFQNRSWLNAVIAAELRIRHATGSVARANLSHSIFGELGAIDSLTARHPGRVLLGVMLCSRRNTLAILTTLRHRIGHIVGVGASKKMIGADAHSVVAGVTNQQVVRHIGKKQCVTYPMSQVHLVSVTERSIAGMTGGTLPFPAFTHWENATPKAITIACGKLKVHLMNLLQRFHGATPRSLAGDAGILCCSQLYPIGGC